VGSGELRYPIWHIPRLFNQITLFDDPLVFPRVDEVGNDDIRVVGPELLFGRIFDHIGFNRVPDQLFRDLVISRITHPGSKLQLAEYLQENNRQEISTDNIYYFQDKLNSKYKHQVEDIGFAHTSKLLNGRIGVVFYDMTTIYFESSQPDELRMTGFSKDGKHQHPQIFLGLLVGKNGYPIGYDIFEGGHIIRLKKSKQQYLVVSYSESRATKDLHNRERGLARLEKSLKRGKLTKANINNRGYNKYLKLTGDVSIEIDYTKFSNDQHWDGLKGYVTNTSLRSKLVIESYNNLWKIEKAFRISKTDLKIRSIYHRLRERIEAHICISFASYVLYNDLERVLSMNTSISIKKAIKQINRMQEIMVSLPGNRIHKIKLRNNELQQGILDAINAAF